MSLSKHPESWESEGSGVDPRGEAGGPSVSRVGSVAWGAGGGIRGKGGIMSPISPFGKDFPIRQKSPGLL